MYAPDVWETTETENATAYRELRHRAGEMGFATVHDALDKLAELMEKEQPR